MTLASTHTGAFQLGQTNAYYLLRVKNTGSAPTSGIVSVVENAPAGLTVTSMLGDGWTCTANSCSRSDALAAGAYYPAIMAVASVAQSAGSSLTNKATVSGGGDLNMANNTASDVTAVSANGYPVGWGNNTHGQTSVPPGLSNVVAVSAGSGYGLALKGDGTVVAWGDNSNGQASPTGISGVVAISAGSSQGLALKSDGTVEAWGRSLYGTTGVPAGLTNVVAVSAGGNLNLALKGDGTVVTWGDITGGPSTVPAGLSGIFAIAAGGSTSLALKSDGTVLAWGNDPWGLTNVPADLTNVSAIAIGAGCAFALKGDGTVVAWGRFLLKDYSSTPATLPSGLSNVVAISAAGSTVLALQGDGKLVAWGDNTWGQATVPAGFADAVGISAGDSFSLALVSAASATIPVTFAISTDPTISSFPGTPGSVFVTVDDGSYGGSPFKLNWVSGSSHTIGTTSPIPAIGDSRNVFTGWSDGGGMTHTVAPEAAVTYTATFKFQRKFTTSVNPPGAGAIAPGTGFFDNGSKIQISATAAQGYVFNGFSGAVTGLANPQSLTISGNVPSAVTANFVPAIVTDLAITSRHTGALMRGQTNAIYVLRVSNALGGAPTGGAVSVTEHPPAGLTVTAMGGTGWTCGGNRCSRTDALAGGLSYPAILVVASVAADAPATLTNQATVADGWDFDLSNKTANNTAAVVDSGYPVAWGDNTDGESVVPSGLARVVSVAAGTHFSLALKSDGTVAAWGENSTGQTTVPEGLSNVVAIAAGDSHTLVLRSDGTVVAWGNNADGQASVPAGLSDVVGIAAGNGQSVALKSDGTIVTWGAGPALPTVPSNVVAISDQGLLALMLRGDGTVSSSGLGSSATGAAGAENLAGVIAVASGSEYSLALKNDGTVQAVGYYLDWHVHAVAAVAPAGLSNVVAIAAAPATGLALKSDGTVAVWSAFGGEAPSVPSGLSRVFAIAAGGSHFLAVRSNADPVPPRLRHPGPSIPPSTGPRR